MIAGPEVARVVQEFEESLDSNHGSIMHTDVLDHEQKRAVQKAFATNVRKMTAVIDEMGNPFTEESNDLLVLETGIL